MKPPSAPDGPWPTGPANLARIPLAYWLADSRGWGVEGVWWAISGTSIVKGILMTGLFSLGRWSRQRV